ncbi:hypothetical protein [Amycolatopsis sp. cg9]|uniref:hypothetical protein n=1 Tax=Amycolatopsis sp. cg9 TaxID=3238801 RepID=UPI003524B78C
MYNESLIPIILLLSSGKEVQRRSQQAVLLNTVPIATNMRGTIGALGAVQQAKQSLVDETQAVNAAADLLIEIIQGGGAIDLARLQADAVLQRIASQELADKLQAVVDLVPTMPDGAAERARPVAGNGEESTGTRRKAVTAGSK